MPDESASVANESCSRRLGGLLCGRVAGHSLCFRWQSEQRRKELLAYGMMALAFPISLLLNLLAGGVGYVAYLMSGYAAETSRLSIVLTWLYFFAGGYWQ